MKHDVDYYMAKTYRVELIPDPDEGGYAIAFPELPGCLSEGDTVEEALANAEDAKREWIMAALEDGFPIPEPQDSRLARENLEDIKDLGECMAIMERVHNGEERTYTAEEVKEELGFV